MAAFFHAKKTELSSCDRDQMASKNKIFAIWFLQKNFANPWFKL